MLDLPEAEHIRLLRDQVRRFVAREMPRGAAARWDREDVFPREVFDKLAGLGVCGLTVPEEYGGAGVDIPACMAVIEELSRRSLAVSVPYIMCTCYAGMNIAEVGSEAQKRELLPRIAAGQMLFAYGLTEPDVGSDLGSVKTWAVREGDEIVINGAKRFCSGADEADYIYALVCSDRAGQRYKNLSFVVIPPHAPGVTVTPFDCMGVHGIHTTDVTFENVRVPAANLVGGDAGWNRGWEMLAGPGLDVEKIEVAAIALGVAWAALEDAWTYAQERKQFGKAIGTYQSIRHMLADMQAKLYTARTLVYQVAGLLGGEGRHGVETAIAKLVATESCKDITLAAQQVMGAYGYASEFPMERYVRDALALPIFGGSSAIQRNNIVNWMGLPK
jgi:alkylation response protein AidB-like acyl-CoA dehydrogenase